MSDAVALKPRLTWWGLSLFAAVVVALVLFLALGPDALPKEGKQTMTPWYGFVAVAVFGALLVLVGGHGAAARHAWSASDDREFTGTKAVVIGGLQCLAGAAAIGMAVYAMAFCEVW